MAPHKKIGIWLMSVSLMILIMTVIGAITRLTESGLSITEWKPVTGALPPLSDAAWQEEFAAYQASPEFAAKHSWMTLADYKHIFFWEWLHRFWGRVIGLAYLIPFVIFWAKGYIAREDRLKFIGLFLLGGLQGFVGWFMVKSGLADQPDVSHYRLALHLSLALILYSALFWMGMSYIRKDKPNVFPRASASLLAHGIVTLAFVAATIIWGAFTAGLDAGLIYNTFPKMGDGLMPPEMWNRSPAISNIFENPASVQFTHRWLAISTGLVAITYALRGLKFDARHFGFLGVWVFVQIALGISTLLSFGDESPMHKGAIHIAATHQFGAVMLLTITLITLQRVISSRRSISL